MTDRQTYRGRLGFTLVEVLIGSMLFTIIMGAIAFGVHSVYNVFKSSEANAIILNALRFTSDSFEREVADKIHFATKVSVLDQLPDRPLSSDEYCLYLDAEKGALTVKDKSGDTPLAGSEHIKQVIFNIPRYATSKPSKYMLHMSLLASYNKYQKAEKTIELQAGLYNEPQFGTTHESGSVLYFASEKEDGLSMVIDSSIFLTGTWRKINNTVGLAKASILEVSYDAKISDNGTMVGYESLSVDIQWYGSFKIDLSESFVIDGANTNQLNVSTHMSPSRYWSGDETFVLCRISAVATLADGRTVSHEAWSPYASILNTDSTSSFWKDWLSGSSGFSDTNNNGRVTITRNASAGTIVMRTFDKTPLASGASSVAKLDFQHMDNGKIHSIWSNYIKKNASLAGKDIPSYITNTNYSVLVDLKAEENVESILLFLGITSGNSNYAGGRYFKDVGYALELKNNDNIVNFGMRSIGIPSTGQNAISDDYFGMSAVMHTKNKADINLKYYDPMMLANKQKYTWNNSWRIRKRYIATVLEYHTGDPTKPKYIVRVRSLTSAGTPDAARLLDDPWCTGPEYYESEPMWFGLPVGASLDIPQPNKLSAIVRHYDGDSCNSRNLRYPLDTEHLFDASNIEGDHSKAEYFGTTLHLRNAYQNSSVVHLKELDIQNNINEQSREFVTSPNRDRYIGIHTIAKNTSSTSNRNVTFYNISITPGFTIDEIKAILPKDGRVYEVADILASADVASITSKNWYPSALDINGSLFGQNAAPYTNKSSGDGMNVGKNGMQSRYKRAGDILGEYTKGIYGLQHVPGTFCTCPLHDEFFKWAGTSTRVFDAEDFINGFRQLLDYTVAHNGILPNEEESAVYNYFKANTALRTLDSDGINFADTVMREFRMMNGIDIIGTTWRIYRRSGAANQFKFNIFWSPENISLLDTSDRINNVFAWHGLDIGEDATILKGSSSINMDQITTEATSAYNIIRLSVFTPDSEE